MKKIITVILVILASSLFLFVFVSLRNGGKDVSPSATSSSPFPVSIPSSTSTIPAATTTTIIKNFPSLNDQETLDRLFDSIKRQGWKAIDYDGNILEWETSDWHLEFQYQYRSISLAVLGYPALEKQKEAEIVLLNALGVTEEEACALGIDVYWKNYETEFMLVYKPLTFCS